MITIYNILKCAQKNKKYPEGSLKEHELINLHLFCHTRTGLERERERDLDGFVEVPLVSLMQIS